MAEQSITIKTVTAPPFKEGNETITPRLKLVVGYTKGGTNVLTGYEIPRGYDIAIRHDRTSESLVYVSIDGKGNPTSTIKPAARFSANMLELLAKEVRDGKHDELITKLYDKAKANRPEYAWPETILPAEDRDGISEASLHTAVMGAE
jgi:hypothetical protein